MESTQLLEKDFVERIKIEGKVFKNKSSHPQLSLTYEEVTYHRPETGSAVRPRDGPPCKTHSGQ